MPYQWRRCVDMAMSRKWAAPEERGPFQSRYDRPRRAGFVRADRCPGPASALESGPGDARSVEEMPLANKTTVYTLFGLAFLATLGYGIMIPSLSVHAHTMGASNSAIG